MSKKFEIPCKSYRKFSLGYKTGFLMDNFRDILSGDCFKLKNYTLNGIDKFGDMLHFQIRRKDMYTTKVGGCVTLTFLLIV